MIDAVSDKAWDFWSDFEKLAARSAVRRGAQELVRMRLVRVPCAPYRTIFEKEVFLPGPWKDPHDGELKLSIF